MGLDTVFVMFVSVVVGETMVLVVRLVVVAIVVAVVVAIVVVIVVVAVMNPS